jgi:hypothetical protein
MVPGLPAGRPLTRTRPAPTAIAASARLGGEAAADHLDVQPPPHRSADEPCVLGGRLLVRGVAALAFEDLARALAVRVRPLDAFSSRSTRLGERLEVLRLGQTICPRS